MRSSRLMPICHSDRLDDESHHVSRFFNSLLGDFTSLATYADYAQRCAVLAAMMIEHHPKHDAVVAVKIGFIVGSIRRALAKDRADHGTV